MYITETLAITDEKLINHVIAVKFLRSWQSLSLAFQ
jgi:hypothetical protein